MQILQGAEIGWLAGCDASERPEAAIWRRERPARGGSVAYGTRTERTRPGAGCGGHPYPRTRRRMGLSDGVTDGSSGVGVGGGGARATRRQAAATAASGVRDGCGTLDASHMARSPAARILHALPAIQRQDAEFCRNGEGWEGGEVHASGRAGRRPCGHGGGGSGCIFCSGGGIIRSTQAAQRAVCGKLRKKKA